MTDVSMISRQNDELRGEVEKISKQLSEYVTEQIAVVDRVTTIAKAQLQADKENVAELREKQRAISAEEEVVQQQGRHERAQVETLKADLDKLHAQEQVLPPESQRLEQQLTQSRALVTRSEAILEQAQRGMEHKLGELDRGISLYKARLGLAFDKVGDDRLRLTFTCIDPTDPERAFCLEVCVTVGDHYVVQSCEPTLTELPGLVHTLNASNDFSAFVRAVRKGFQRLV